MRTRTLLLLAVTCGLAILLAGGIQLLRIANQDEPAPLLQQGDTGSAGDAQVTLVASEIVADGSADDGVLVVTVTVSGVDDPDGIDGFVLRAPGKEVTPEQGAGSCSALTVEPTTCDLRFRAGDLPGTSRVLVFQRAEGKAVWQLAG